MHPLDQIALTGLRAFAHHGVYDDERRDGQTFVLDVTVHLPLGGSDELGATIHYGELAQEVVDAVQRDPVDLIETVAERVAEVVLAHERAVFVTVTVHKPDAPIPVPFADAAVTIHRGRPERMRAVGEAMAATAVVDDAEPAGSEAVAPEPPLERAVIALGSNLGDREATIRAAVRDLAGLPRTTVVAASGLVQTPAVKPDGVDLDAPAYLNAVVLLDTTLVPRALMVALHGIERAHGRERAERWGDRTLDLDLIAYGQQLVAGGDLTVPHPRAAERDFVLAPWLQLDPDAVLPGVGPVAALLRASPEPYPAEPLL